jgi:hypothetical protein
MDTNIKVLTDKEKLTFITTNEYEIVKAILNGHKAVENDQFEEQRKLIKQYREELGLITPR